MGEIVDMILDGILDEQTGEYLGGAVGYPRTRQKGHYNTIRYKRTPAEKKIAAIRKELAILIKAKQAAGVHNAVGESRREINIKYTKNWRSESYWTDEQLKTNN